MPAIGFTKNRPAIVVEDGTNLMQALLKNGVPVASSCGGEGVCAKCRIEIMNGRTSLSAETELEIYLRERHGLGKAERIACQVSIHGDVTVDAPYW